MVTKNFIRLLFCIIASMGVSSLLYILNLGDVSPELPKTLFDVQGVLFPVALAIATSIDLTRVRNKDYLKSFRESLRKVRLSLIIQFVFSVLAIGLILFIGDKQQCFTYKRIAIYPRLTGCIIIGYSIAHTIYNFTQIQKNKEELEDQLQKEIKPAETQNTRASASK